MGMVEDYGKVILLKKEIIKRGYTGDHVTDYTFKNTFCLYENIIAKVQSLENAKSVHKGLEKWLECTHEVIMIDTETITVRFVTPYCG